MIFNMNLFEFQSPMFWRQCSIFTHSLLFIGLLVSWLWKVVKSAQTIINRHLEDKNRKVYLLSSIALFVYNLVIVLFNCLHYYYFDSDDDLDHDQVTRVRLILFDFTVRALTWFLVVVYLQCNNSIFKFLLLVTIWWGCYLAVSSYCLVTQFIKLQYFNFLVLVLDIVYVVLGILFLFSFCWISYSNNSVGDEGGLQQPLFVSDDPENSVDIIDSSHSSQTKQAISSYSKAGFLSTVTFYWVGSLISKGHHKTTLDLDDIPPLSWDDDASESYKVFRKCLQNAKGVSSADKVTTMQLAKSLIILSWPNILWTFILSLLNTLAIYVGPYLIDSFVQYASGVKVSRTRGYVLISAFLVAKLVECVSAKHSEFKIVKIKLKTRAALIQSIYIKALTLSCTSKEGSTTGEMINILSVDAERVGGFSYYMHDPWLIILQLALALSILSTTLGLASIAAFVATVLVMLAYYPVSKLFSRYYKNLMQSRDQRMKITTEILKNMRILKLQAWDMKFLSKIYDLRNVESDWLKRTVSSMALTASVFWIAPTFVSVVTFSTCILIGVPLESGKVLSAIATFKMLQNAIIDLPNLISTTTQIRVSLSRIASFLSLNELSVDAEVKLPESSRIDIQVVVEISGGNFIWDQLAQHPTLKDINIKVGQGMRIAVCGRVGSGKSTLLSCILGEVPKVSGVIHVGGSTAYVPQTAWIQSGSIADNILFGKEMHVERYNRVLEACCLRKDLEVLPFGDQTVIGERGINLSGGQKQRIQIARALYQNADIYLLDDPFSAVDAHTRTHLFKNCILELLQSKTVMYVTHQVEFLRVADLILVMKEGSIQQVGTYKDILNSGKDLKELVAAHEHALSTTLDFIGTSSSIASIVEDNSDEKGSKEETDDSDALEEDKRPKGQLVQEEEREKGRVKAHLYWKYLTTAYEGALVPIILVSQILFQFLQISSNYWIAWATPVSHDAKHVADACTLLIVYVALAVGSSFCILVRSWLHVLAGYKTASSIFYQMHSSLFRAPMSFFDATPSGRILSRMSTDQASVDTSAPNRVGGFAFSLISLLAVIGVMSLVVWQVYMIFIPVIVVSLWYQKFYITSARELSRLVGVNKAPVIQHFSESISGVAVIRSFGRVSSFCERNTRLINDSARPTLYYSASTQWLNFRLDMLSSLIFACSLIFLISIPVGSFDPVIAGLAVAYALNLNELQNRVISNFATMENTIISVERVLQYTGITSEAALVLENNRPDQSWPFCGEVHVQDLQVRYASQLPLVLRGLTCTFQGGKTTGIVGRTGCGKSTLIQALFRLVEPAAGKIIIDGIDISSIGLHDLRSRLSIIPQDPTMFQGTLRSNLDPLEEYTDEQIWEALDKCELGDEIRNRESKLHSTVSENGENWSVGQRQLICLGRVLLKRSKVLVLDEATASVDTATDNLIQQTLKDHFSDSTVIVIAHRITSVINSDQVIVLNHGAVEECDIPSRLLLNHSSSFSKLVNEYTTRSKSKTLDTRMKKQNP